jgi:hypothetical protein
MALIFVVVANKNWMWLFKTYFPNWKKDRKAINIRFVL